MACGRAVLSLKTLLIGRMLYHAGGLFSFLIKWVTTQSMNYQPIAATILK